MDATWTLAELVDEATRALARVPAPENGQVRAVPDERSLRYYTTLGLVDRPAAMRGRTALYNRRHLAQVVAIKRLQSAGKSLAEIQGVLGEIDDATLARLSGVAVPSAPPRAARADFWRAAPIAPPAPAPTPTALVPAGARTTLRLTLAPGVELLLDVAPGAPPFVDVPSALAAAAPLLAELTRQGLVPEGDPGRPSEPKDGGP